MVEKIVDRKVRPVTLPGALLIWCLRFLFAEFLEARIAIGRPIIFHAGLQTSGA
jgi:hypothetical protein